MKLRTLFLYLLGSRQAILNIANNPHSLWIGAIFVLSAGLAREYDQEDLLHEPWYLLIPFGASLVTSFILFQLIRATVFGCIQRWPTKGAAYRSFLSLFWMTAPLAWLYAIPFERFLAPLDAVKANLWTLGLVAVWRVLLMMRVLYVLMDLAVPLCIGVVMLFACGVAFISVWLTPVSVVAIMSGTGLSESEQIISSVQGLVCCFSVVGGLAAMVLASFCQRYSIWNADALIVAEQPVPRGVQFFAIASVALWAFILPITQPEQQRRREVEKLIKNGEINLALDRMEAVGQAGFPPLWDPPPRGWALRLYRVKPSIWDILATLTARQTAPWIRAVYIKKLKTLHPGEFMIEFYSNYGDAQLTRQILHVAKRMPEVREWLVDWEKENMPPDARLFQKSLTHNTSLSGNDRCDTIKQRIRTTCCLC